MCGRSASCVYEMLTGQRPFKGDDVSETLASVLTRQPDWTMLPAATPPLIRRLLRRCLEKDRTRRLADMADARLDIDEALSGSDIDAPVALSTSRTRERLAWASVAAACRIDCGGDGGVGHPLSVDPSGDDSHDPECRAHR